MGRFWTFCPLRDLSPLQAPLRADRLTGRPLTGRLLTGRLGPYRKPYEEGRSLREGPGCRTGPSQRRTTKRLTGRPLTGRLLSRRPLTNYRKAYGKLGQTLAELGGNFRLCAVDQKRPFFPRAGPFLDLLPFKGPFSLTGALTGPPYGKAPYGEAQKAPYEEGRSLRGPVRVLHREGRRRGLREGRALTGSTLRGGTVLTRRAGPLWKGRVLHREGRRRGLREGRAITEGPYEEGRSLHKKGRRRGLREGRALTGSPLRGGAVLTGRAGVQRSLREATGRDFTRIGREFPLVCRRPKKAVFFLGLGPFWPSAL